MAEITDEILKEKFPELFIEHESEKEKERLLKIREAIRTRLTKDKQLVEEQSKQGNFTLAEKFLYSAMLFLNLKKDIEIKLLEVKVDFLEEEIEQLKKSKPPPVQKKIKKK